jgi:hypothetical protein
MFYLKNINYIIENIPRTLFFDRVLNKGNLYNRDLFEKIINFIGSKLFDKNLDEIPQDPKYFEEHLLELPGLSTIVWGELIKAADRTTIFNCLYKDFLDYNNETAKRAPAIEIFPVIIDLGINGELNVDLKTIYSVRQRRDILANYIVAGCKRSGEAIARWLEKKRLYKEQVLDIENPLSFPINKNYPLRDWDNNLFSRELRDLLYFENPLIQLGVNDIKRKELREEKYYREFNPEYQLNLIMQPALDNELICSFNIELNEKENDRQLLKEYKFYYLNPEKHGLYKDDYLHYLQQLTVFKNSFEKYILPKLKTLKEPGEILLKLLEQYQEFADEQELSWDSLEKLSGLLTELGFRFFFNVYERSFTDLVEKQKIEQKTYTCPNSSLKSLFLQFKVFQYFTEISASQLTEYKKFIDYKKLKNEILGLNDKLYFLPETQQTENYTYDLLLENSFERPQDKTDKKYFRRIAAKLNGQKGYYFIPAHFFQTENIYNLINIYGELQIKQANAEQDMTNHLLKIILESGVERKRLSGIAGEKHPLTKKIQELEKAEQEKLLQTIRAEETARKLAEFNTFAARLSGALTAALSFVFTILADGPVWLGLLLSTVCGSLAYWLGGKIFSKNGLVRSIIKVFEKKKLSPTISATPKKQTPYNRLPPKNLFFLPSWPSQKQSLIMFM